MTTIPSRLAQAARTSGGAAEARARVFSAYRDWYRGAPEIIRIYGLSISPQFFRQAIRARFEENRYVSDPRVIDVLLHKSHIEYQESMNQWKNNDHILGILLQPKRQPPKTFMQKFLEGRDEDAALPAASGTL